jgi:hypothetical protein
MLSDRWQTEHSKEKIMVALEPPSGKKHADIELKIFAESRPRRSAPGGWQSLDIDSD